MNPMNAILTAACVAAGAALVMGGAAALERPALALNPGKPEATKPEAKSQDLIETLSADSNYSQLVELVKTAGMVEALKGKGPFTIFAPTNDAFAKLPKERLAALLRPENKAELQRLLKYHIIPASVASADLLKLRESSRTLAGITFNIVTRDGKIRVGGDTRGMANVTKTDVACSNGIVHTIDGVMSPPVRDNAPSMGPKEPE